MDYSTKQPITITLEICNQRWVLPLCCNRKLLNFMIKIH